MEVWGGVFSDLTVFFVEQALDRWNFDRNTLWFVGALVANNVALGNRELLHYLSLTFWHE